MERQYSSQNSYDAYNQIVTTVGVCGHEILALVPPAKHRCQMGETAPANWVTNTVYQQFQTYAENPAAINGTAESAVKDVTEFAAFFQDIDHRKNVIKNVNSHEELYDFANLNKDEIANIYRNLMPGLLHGLIGLNWLMTHNSWHIEQL